MNDVGTYPANGRPPFCVYSESSHIIRFIPTAVSRFRSNFHRLPISASFVVTIITNHACFETDTVFYRESEYLESTDV